MKYGLKSVTMDDLCREIGVSKKTIYKYFDDKNDLVLNMMQAKIAMDANNCCICEHESHNAIDALISISKLVIEQLSNINPSVFFDLQKHYPEAWKLMNDHKWEFVLNNIRENIIRGKSENIYRENLDPEIISRYYVSNIDSVMDGEVYPYQDFKTDEVLSEVLRFQIRGLANDNGINYLKEHFNREINE
jgi:AcrR family transcriptional regulator